MKANDIVNQLQAALPSVTNLFSESLSVAAMTYAAGIVTVDTDAAHGLNSNDFANISGATSPVAITSITRSGTIATAITTTDHDLTFGIGDARRKDKTVLLSGSIEPEFNGDFELLSTINRRTFTFKVADSGPIIATGTSLLQDGSQLPGFNGWQKITVIDLDTFTYPVTQVLFATAGGTPIVKKNVRVSRALSIEQAANAYTKQATADLWGFVTLGDVIASKNRNIESDLTDTAKPNTAWNQRISQPLAIYVFKGTTDDISGGAARDEMEDVSIALFKSLLGVQFPCYYAANLQYVLTFANHGFQDFNGSYYIHQFNFELAADITFGDTVGYELNTAFKDISLSILPDIGTGKDPATANLDLDEVPLP